MKGVLFGTIHSYNDLKLILAPFTPTPAEPQTNFLKVTGRDGDLDLTEANGEVKFNSRQFDFTFTIAPGDKLTFDERVTAVSNALNGVQCKITLERDPDYYWFGRCSVNKYAQNKNIGQIAVKAIVAPYKLKQEETVAVVTLTGEDQTISLDNGRMAAIPTIQCTNENTVVTFDGGTYTLAAGISRILGIRFVEGANVLTVNGSGTITFKWQEGEL